MVRAVLAAVAAVLSMSGGVLTFALCAAAVLVPGRAAATDCGPLCAFELCWHQDADEWAVAEGVIVSLGTDDSPYEVEVEHTSVRGPLAAEAEANPARYVLFLPRENLAAGQRLIFFLARASDGSLHALSDGLLIDDDDRAICPHDDRKRMSREQALRFASESDCDARADEAGWDDECGGCMGCASGGAAEAGTGGVALLAVASARRRRRGGGARSCAGARASRDRS